MLISGKNSYLLNNTLFATLIGAVFQIIIIIIITPAGPEYIITVWR